MWPATLGYFLEELLETEAARQRSRAAVLHRRRRGARQPAGDSRRQAALRRAGHERVQPLAGQRRRSTDHEAAFLRQVHEVLTKVQTQWQQLVGQVSHVDAPGDSFAHLLNILGLQPTSVDYQRRDRHVPDLPVEPRAPDDRRQLRRQQSDGALLPGRDGARHPAHRTSSASSSRDCRSCLACCSRARLTAERAADRRRGDGRGREAVRRRDSCRRSTRSRRGDDPDEVEARNYIGWIVGSTLDALKQQTVREGRRQRAAGAGGAALPAACIARCCSRATTRR